VGCLAVALRFKVLSETDFIGSYGNVLGAATKPIPLYILSACLCALNLQERIVLVGRQM